MGLETRQVEIFPKKGREEKGVCARLWDSKRQARALVHRNIFCNGNTHSKHTQPPLSSPQGDTQPSSSARAKRGWRTPGQGWRLFPPESVRVFAQILGKGQRVRANARKSEKDTCAIPGSLLMISALGLRPATGNRRSSGLRVPGGKRRTSRSAGVVSSRFAVAAVGVAFQSCRG